jgi:membrane associated rhomboid family serine protease
MMLREPDPAFTSSARAQANFLLAVRVATWALIVLWLTFGATVLLSYAPLEWGLKPRQAVGLIGVVSAPFLHASFGHLLANTVPLWVGLVAMLFLYPNSALRALPFMWLGSGGLTWLLGREATHVGASGLVYAILTYVFVAGLLRRDLRSIGVCLMLAFFYGYMVWGVFPSQPSMSWEMHLFGLLSGLVLALWYRHWDLAPLKVYDWELEAEAGENDDEDDDESAPSSDRSDPFR